MSSAPASPAPAAADASPGVTLPGRVTVSSRALERIFSAVAAETLGAPARQVSARLSDDSGRLRVDVTGPAARPSGDDSLVAVGARTRERVRDDGGRITGSVVGDVGLRITGCLAPRDGLR